jgi:lipopolysaccharide export system permease protein
MLKNKIYRYVAGEVFKTFFTVLFAFTAIAWTVRAVSFLDLVVEDGHSMRIYMLFSFFNLSNIITKFIPLSFLLALTMSIIKFERQNELIILWTNGLNKIKIVNLFFGISFLILILQLTLATFITPNALNKSRSLVRLSSLESIN